MTKISELNSIPGNVGDSDLFREYKADPHTK